MNEIKKIENPNSPIVFDFRNLQVMIDLDMAIMYEVSLDDLHLALETYKNRFPEDFMIELNVEENKAIYEAHARFKSQEFCSLKTYAFTDKGMFMLSSILDTDKAVNININILRSIASQRTSSNEKSVSHEDVKQALLMLDNKINMAVKALNEKIETYTDDEEYIRKSVGYTYNQKDENLKNKEI